MRLCVQLAPACTRVRIGNRSGLAFRQAEAGQGLDILRLRHILAGNRLAGLPRDFGGEFSLSVLFIATQFVHLVSHGPCRSALPQLQLRSPHASLLRIGLLLQHLKRAPCSTAAASDPLWFSVYQPLRSRVKGTPEAPRYASVAWCFCESRRFELSAFRMLVYTSSFTPAAQAASATA